MEQLSLTYRNHSNSTKKGLLMVSPFGKQGLTKTILNKAIKRIPDRDFSKVFYIGPTAQKVEMARRIFSSIAPHDAYITPEFFTIKQFAQNLYERFGEREYLPEYLKPIIISEIKENIGLGYAQHVVKFIKDIRHYLPDFTCGELKEQFKKELEGYHDVYHKSQDAVDIMELYINALGERHLADDEEILSLAPSFIAKYLSPPKLLIVDGFYDLTRLEERILTTLLDKSKGVLATAFYDGRCPQEYEIPGEFLSFLRETGYFEEEEYQDVPPKREGLKLFAFPSAEEEIEGMAREIKRRFLEDDLSLHDTIITFSRVTHYAPSVHRIFLKYGIPHIIYLDRPLKTFPPVMAVLELLNAVSHDFPRLSTAIALSSPYFPQIPPEAKEWASCYSKKAAIIKGKVRWQGLSRLLRESGEIENSEWTLIKKVQKGIDIFFNQLEGFKEEGSLSQHTKALREALAKLGFCQNLREDNPLLEAKKRFFEILSSLEHLEERFGKTTYSLSRFIKIIDYLTGMIKCPVEKGGEGVRIMGLLETRGIDTQNLFFGGVCEGKFPGHPDHDPILPERVKIRLGLPNVDRYLKRQRLHYFRICTSSVNEPYLSYPTTEGDRLLLPSPFFEGEIISLSPEKYLFSPEEEMCLQGQKDGVCMVFEGVNFSQDSEVKDYLVRRFGPHEYLSVTGLERYRYCPYLFYLENVLNLRIQQEPTYEVEAKIWGTLTHRILAMLYQDGDVSLDNIDERIMACTEKVLNQQRHPRFWSEIARRIFKNIIPQFIAYERELREEGFYPFKVEYVLRQEVSTGLRLKGRIDRVDKRDGDTRIIDYKTGKVGVTQTMMDKGIHIQLPLYAKLLELTEPHLRIEKLGIYSLGDMKIDWFPRGERDVGHLIDVSLEAAKSAAESIRRGIFHPKPSSERNCRRCDCRFSCAFVLDTETTEK